jgi:LmbE family N-acetylglucosaminyl deacetylase
MPRAFAVFAHPDDIEFVAAGTLIRFRDVGYEIHYMNVADGCCGSTQYDRETLARMRREESQAACERIGAIFHDSIAHDMDVFYDRETLARMAAVMREVAPEIVLTHAPHDYMEDHMNTCRLAVTAAFARGMPNFPTKPATAITEQSVTVYHAQPHGNCDPLCNPIRPQLCVDVGDLLDEKAAMLECHVSQKRWLDESQGLDSYTQTMRDLMRDVGRISEHFEYAEGWRKHLHLGFCSADADPLFTSLERWCVKL